MLELCVQDVKHLTLRSALLRQTACMRASGPGLDVVAEGCGWHYSCSLWP